MGEVVLLLKAGRGSERVDRGRFGVPKIFRAGEVVFFAVRLVIRATLRGIRLDPVEPVSMLSPEKMDTVTLGEKIRTCREGKGISVRELARRTDVSASLLSLIERGSRYPSEAVLDRLAGELGVSAAGLRKLDERSSLAKLRLLLKSDPSWGVAFAQIASAARSGKLTSDELLRLLGLRN